MTIWFVSYLKYFGGLRVGDTVFLLGTSFKLSEGLWNMSIHFGDTSSHFGELKSSFEIIAKPQEILDKKTAIELNYERNF